MDINSIEEMKIIREIVIKDPEAKWIVEGIGLPIINFPLMSGARTINSTNFYPDLGRWHMIDPNAEFEDVYNRYAHIPITYFNEDKIRDKFILTSPDSFTVYLNYDELKKLDVKYIFSSNNFTDLDKFSLIIETAAYKIYKLN